MAATSVNVTINRNQRRLIFLHHKIAHTPHDASVLNCLSEVER